MLYCKYKPLHYQSLGIDHIEDNAIPDDTIIPFLQDHLNPCIGQGISVF